MPLYLSGVLSFLFGVYEVSAHGSVVHPPPREAIDGSSSPWNGTVPDYPIPFMFWCATASAEAHGHNVHNLTGRNGQACFWFSNGCDISCDECDGDTGQKVQPRFIYSGPKGKNTGWTGKDIIPDPHHKQPGGGLNARSICKNPKRNATICDPNHRTVNTNAECGGPEDYYYYAPWRYPGSAPVIDSCGVAGGRLPGQGSGSAGADYRNTSNAKLGDKGSKLPPRPSGTVWKAGTSVEVSWTVKAYHGGGYSYRLCPANDTLGLTEACFQKYPLKFNHSRRSSLRWGGVEGKQIWFDAVYVSDGTHPVGSEWAKMPIPAGPWGYVLHGATFLPMCQEPAECVAAVDKNPPFMTCQCSGDGIGDIPTLEIIDYVELPASLNQGDWVLSWRWDCEESTQVWNSCSDVTIK